MNFNTGEGMIKMMNETVFGEEILGNKRENGESLIL